MRLYAYVGPPEILANSAPSLSRRLIKNARDVADWVHDTKQTVSRENEITATFIVSTDGRLWVADRHSEHVACAAGLQVLAAGEMTFRNSAEQVEVVAVSNQSTGFCPEPESWFQVAHVLDAAKLLHPNGFTNVFEFRRCDSCGTTNIVKDGWFWCEACDARLSPRWNYAR
jgi:hypothetical protein